MMDQDEGQKVSQEEANYRRGQPTKHCGVCMYYEGEDTKSCSRVDGPISGFGISDVFAMQKNPFGSMIGPREARMIDSMMASGPDQSPHVAPTVQIGNRRY
jgi:hypothetical protein